MLGATSAFAKAPQLGSARQWNRIAQYPFAFFAALQGNVVPMATVIALETPPTGVNEPGEANENGTKEADGQNNNMGTGPNEPDGNQNQTGPNQDDGNNGQSGGGNN
jgi:hypothetical protein